MSASAAGRDAAMEPTPGALSEPDSGIKMIITCRRNTALSRPAFYDHLRNQHWPLIRRYPAVEAALDGYLQNHALGSDTPAALKAPLRIADDRDSVIELFFDHPDGIQRLVSLSEYQAHIRPDEQHFNDLASNIMAITRPEETFANGRPGRCKRFDFLHQPDGVSSEDFLAALRDEARLLALDPYYTGHIDRHVLNVAIAGDDRRGFGTGQLSAIREVWSTSFASLSDTAHLYQVAADAQRSFSVFATEFTMKAPANG